MKAPDTLIQWPPRIIIKGSVYYFDMVAPITGDPIYKNIDPRTLVVSHALIRNPNDWENQRRALRR